MHLIIWGSSYKHIDVLVSAFYHRLAGYEVTQKHAKSVIPGFVLHARRKSYGFRSTNMGRPRSLEIAQTTAILDAKCLYTRNDESFGIRAYGHRDSFCFRACAQMTRVCRTLETLTRLDVRLHCSRGRGSGVFSRGKFSNLYIFACLPNIMFCLESEAVAVAVAAAEAAAAGSAATASSLRMMASIEKSVGFLIALAACCS